MVRGIRFAGALLGFVASVSSAKRVTRHSRGVGEEGLSSQPQKYSTRGRSFKGDVYRGEVLHFIANPFDIPDAIGAAARRVAESSRTPLNVAAGHEKDALEYFPDGFLAVTDEGLVHAVGHWADLEGAIGGRCGRRHRGCKVVDCRGKLIIPGFVDTHIHAPQIGMTAAFGESLIPWLNKYTFPAEAKYNDSEYAKEQSEKFIQYLLSAGTTTPLAFSTKHQVATDAVFEAASKVNMRIIAGRVLMDEPSNTPEFLRDESPQKAYEETKALIERWHGRGRNLYAVTPRFAPTSSLEQLRLTGELLKEHPDVYMHTHMSENLDEVSWVNWQFSGENGADPARKIPAKGYLDVYDHFGLLGPRSIFAHSIHLSQSEWNRMAETNSTIAWCPTSNNFLGSGLFNLRAAVAAGVRVGMGSDVGAGTAFSMIRTLGEAYKVTKLGESWMRLLDGYTNQVKGPCSNPDFPECGVPANDIVLSAVKAIYLATLGGARQLSLDDKIGNFLPGKEADFVVLDWDGGRDFLADRMGESNLVSDDPVEKMLEKIFVLMMMGDDRHVEQTYIMGKLKYISEESGRGSEESRRRRKWD